MPGEKVLRIIGCSGEKKKERGPKIKEGWSMPSEMILPPTLLPEWHGTIVRLCA